MKPSSRREFLRAGATPAFAAVARNREASGYYRVEEIDGVWWFVNPKGKPVVSLGVNHAEPGLMLTSFNREVTIERYGKDFVKPDGTFNPAGEGARKWVNRLLADLDDWGFSALGFHNRLPRPLFKDRIAFSEPVVPYWITPYGRPAEYVDVFSRQVGDRIAETARDVCLAFKNEPNLLGYAYNDRPRYNRGGGPQGRRVPVHPWVDALRRLGPDAAGKQKWVDVLKARHSGAPAAAQTHGFEAAAWEELLARTEWPNPQTPAADADKDALLPLIFDQWYRLHYESIRRYDPNHLILGDKLGGGFAPADSQPEGHPNISEYQYATLKKYVDVITIEWYGRWQNQEKALRNIHRGTGKPILLGDSSFSQLQPRQQNCKGIRVESQAAVGEEYSLYLEQAMGEPYVLGWHFCGYIENWTDPAKPGMFEAQNGFKDPFEKVHEEAITRVRAANRRAQSWHASVRRG